MTIAFIFHGSPNIQRLASVASHPGYRGAKANEHSLRMAELRGLVASRHELGFHDDLHLLLEPGKFASTLYSSTNLPAQRAASDFAEFETEKKRIVLLAAQPGRRT
jgi:hypothetical protein